MKGILIRQDNAPAHKSLVSMSDVCDCSFELVDQSPNSSDLALS